MINAFSTEVGETVYDSRLYRVFLTAMLCWALAALLILVIGKFVHVPHSLESVASTGVTVCVVVNGVFSFAWLVERRVRARRALRAARADVAAVLRAYHARQTEDQQVQSIRNP